MKNYQHFTYCLFVGLESIRYIIPSSHQFKLMIWAKPNFHLLFRYFYPYYSLVHLHLSTFILILWHRLHATLDQMTKIHCFFAIFQMILSSMFKVALILFMSKNSILTLNSIVSDQKFHFLTHFQTHYFLNFQKNLICFFNYLFQRRICLIPNLILEVHYFKNFIKIIWLI